MCGVTIKLDIPLEPNIEPTFSTVASIEDQALSELSRHPDATPKHSGGVRSRIREFVARHTK